MTWTIGRRDDASWVARTLVADALDPVAPPTLVADALLLTSELVTNAMMHTDDAECTLGLTFDPTQNLVHVEVTDRSPNRLAAAASPSPADRIGGYGMTLVARLADEWGCDTDSHRKTVWFELGGTRP